MLLILATNGINLCIRIPSRNLARDLANFNGNNIIISCTRAYITVHGAKFIIIILTGRNISETTPVCDIGVTFELRVFINVVSVLRDVLILY